MAADHLIAAVEKLDRSDRRRTPIMWGLIALVMAGGSTGIYGLYLAESGHNADQAVITTLSERLCRHDIADALNAKFRQDVRAFFGARTPGERLFAEEALGQPEPRVSLAKCGHPIQLQEVPVPIPVLTLPSASIPITTTTPTTTSPPPTVAPPTTVSPPTTSTTVAPPPPSIPCRAVVGRICVPRG